MHAAWLLLVVWELGSMLQGKATERQGKARRKQGQRHFGAEKLDVDLRRSLKLL